MSTMLRERPAGLGAVDYFAPNLPANQLVVFAPGVGPGDVYVATPAVLHHYGIRCGECGNARSNATAMRLWGPGGFSWSAAAGRSQKGWPAPLPT